MNARTVATVVAAIISSAGCTGYHRQGFTGGFSETQLAPDVFNVRFRGNAYTSAERANDFALLRAAELTREHGYTHFVLVSEKEEIRVSSFSTPGSLSLTTEGNSSKAIYTGGQSYTHLKPETSVRIRCFSSRPEGIEAFDAAFVEQSLKAKHKIK